MGRSYPTMSMSSPNIWCFGTCVISPRSMAQTWPAGKSPRKNLVWMFPCHRKIKPDGNTGWWFFATPLKNIWSSSQLGWFDYSQNMKSHVKFHGSSHHQPEHLCWWSTPIIIPRKVSCPSALSAPTNSPPGPSCFGSTAAAISLDDSMLWRHKHWLKPWITLWFCQNSYWKWPSRNSEFVPLKRMIFQFVMLTFTRGYMIKSSCKV